MRTLLAIILFRSFTGGTQAVLDHILLDHAELAWHGTHETQSLSSLVAHLQQHPPTVTPVNTDLLLRTSRDLEMLQTLVVLRLRQMIWNPRLSHIERLLLEFIELHTVQEIIQQGIQTRTIHHRDWSDANAVYKALGAMIQQRLTLLLVQLDPEEFDLVYCNVKFSGINIEEWKSAIRGASSVARAIKAILQSQWKKRVLLATLEEDFSLGTDLIILPSRLPSIALAVAVSSNRDELGATFDILNGGSEDQRVVQGVRTLQQRYPARTWYPVLLNVGRPRKGHRELSFHRTDVGSFDTFMKQLNA